MIHIIDLATRFSVCKAIKNKQSETIIQAIMTSWINIFGSPKKILSDNGGEFNSACFR
jgi:transposase InsO family protein